MTRIRARSDRRERARGGRQRAALTDVVPFPPRTGAGSPPYAAALCQQRGDLGVSACERTLLSRVRQSSELVGKSLWLGGARVSPAFFGARSAVCRTRRLPPGVPRRLSRASRGLKPAAGRSAYGSKCSPGAASSTPVGEISNALPCPWWQRMHTKSSVTAALPCASFRTAVPSSVNIVAASRLPESIRKMCDDTSPTRASGPSAPPTVSRPAAGGMWQLSHVSAST